MNLANTNVNTIWAYAVIDELVRNGVNCFCLCPGARSGLLATAIARHPDAKAKIHYDERGAAFYALGHARATGLPAVWVTTSGTAVANGFPAAVEAAQDGIPLLLLTADRPPELRDTGANQAILQSNLFAPYQRWHVDMPCPTTDIDLNYVRSTIDYAFARTQGPNPGPVHVNMMFREPLSTESDGIDYQPYLDHACARDEKLPHTVISAAQLAPSQSDISYLIERFEHSATGVLLVGRLSSDAERAAAQTLAQRLSWPVIADIGSGVRLSEGVDGFIPYADQVLLALSDAFSPECIVHIGGPFVSKRLLQWLKRVESEYVLIQPHPRRQDVTQRAARVIESDLSLLVSALPESLQMQASPSLEQWHQASRRVKEVVHQHVERATSLDEIGVAQMVSTCAGRAATFAGNSMPIRDLDMYGMSQPDAQPVTANRGASGIDGTVATACGWAAGLQQPVIAVLGDLAVLHDLNSLSLMKTLANPLILVVINNDGGGIFSFLPVAAESDIFEQHFGTPHGFTFEAAADQFHIPYAHPTSPEAFLNLLTEALDANQSMLIEVTTDRRTNVELHHALQAEIKRRLATQ